MSARDDAIQAAERAIAGMRAASDPAAVRIIINAFESAMLARGWKMTPRQMSDEMKEAYTGSAIDPESDWEPVWDAASGPGGTE